MALSEVIDGATLREHYEVMWKRSGEKPVELCNVLPDDLKYLWQWFVDLHNSRQVGMSGLQPIAYSEIESWARITGNTPTAWEVKAIKALDTVSRKPKEQ